MSDNRSTSPALSPLTRIQLFTNRGHRRHALVFGACQGLLCGTAFALLQGAQNSEASAMSLVLTAVGGGVFFGFWMGLFTAFQGNSSRCTTAPPETDPEQVREAGRLLILGRPGPDTEVNDLAAEQAHKDLATGFAPKAAIATALAVACAAAALYVPFPGPLVRLEPILWVISLVTVLTMAVYVPLQAHRRSRSRQFLYRESRDDPAPGGR